jgi:putative sigma-54 modulation protein
MYSAIDMVMDKLEKQIKKNKQKNRAHRQGSKARAADILAQSTISTDEDVERRLVVKNIEYKPMDIEEAMMQMDLVNDNFIVFTDSRTDKVNVLYRRKDGHYGLIQPSS